MQRKQRKPHTLEVCQRVRAVQLGADTTCEKEVRICDGATSCQVPLRAGHRIKGSAYAARSMTIREVKRRLSWKLGGGRYDRACRGDSHKQHTWRPMFPSSIRGRSTWLRSQ